VSDWSIAAVYGRRSYFLLGPDGRDSQSALLGFISKYRRDGVVLPMGLRLAQLGR
jgi:hypothetical protein